MFPANLVAIGQRVLETIEVEVKALTEKQLGNSNI
jgi:hypothetical protein